MAYSIQYGTTIKHRKRRDHRFFWAIMILLLAILGRIFADSRMATVQTLLFGEPEAVAVFYEDFVKH